ncbi:hypothetical protein KIN20_015173 [Parelaphostrongylus tenuis]|uniref:Uncharacterized protein n=1 Tax=Parelaphostrongylus tenuis TaxID=148309 RepID=A0AAD5MZY1_PARTN|nr:hypothetical protein KIN20_015173 [Parelaphostrongylus tenuis]
MDTSKTTSSADLDFTELFSCFDGAQSYFETDYVPAFHDLHIKFSQYPAKITRMKTYNVELKEKYMKELAAIEKRLSEMNAATEMWKVQCEDQQRRINELENEVIIRKNEGRG